MDTFLSYIHAHLPQTVVAISVLMYPMLQGLKAAVPDSWKLCGWKMVLINIAVAIITVWAVTPASDFFTLDAWMRVIEASGLAAGIHGTISALGTKAPGVANAAKGTAAVLILFLCAGLLAGCTDWERTTFNTLAASKAVIDQAQVDYEVRAIPKTAANQKAINEAKDLQTIAVQGLETYEQMKAAKASTDALNGQIAAVNTLLANLAPLIADIRAFYTAASTPGATVQPSPLPSGPVQPTAWLRDGWLGGPLVRYAT